MPVSCLWERAAVLKACTETVDTLLARQSNGIFSNVIDTVTSSATTASASANTTMQQTVHICVAGMASL